MASGSLPSFTVLTDEDDVPGSQGDMRISLVGAIIWRQMIVVFKCKRSFQSHFRNQYHTFSQVI